MLKETINPIKKTLRHLQIEHYFWAHCCCLKHLNKMYQSMIPGRFLFISSTSFADPYKYTTLTCIQYETVLKHKESWDHVWNLYLTNNSVYWLRVMIVYWLLTLVSKSEWSNVLLAISSISSFPDSSETLQIYCI